MPKTAYNKLEENLAYLRSRNAPKERIKAEIEKYRQSQNRVSANERKLSGAEKVAAVGSKLASGATFGLFDELTGLGGQGEKDTQRFLQNQLEEENPGVALGAEVLGGFAVPGAVFKVPGKLAAGASRAAKAKQFAKTAGSIVGEGVVQGGASGVGNAEGGLEERLRGAMEGGIAGGATAGLLSGVGRGFAGLRRATAKARDVHSPSLEEIASGTPREDLLEAANNWNKFKLARVDDETTMADVLPSGPGLLRAQRTASKGVANEIDQALGQRSNRLTNRGDERFSEYTGTQRQSGPKSRAEKLKKAQTEAKPLYEGARDEAASYDLATAPQDWTTPEVLNRPFIKKAVRRVIADDPQRFGGNVLADPRLSHDMFDQAYKDMGEDIRYLKSKVAAKTASASERRQIKRMVRERDHLLEAIKVRSPSYPKALDKYAGEIAHRDAYELGAKKKPADIIPDELAELEPSVAPSYKEGVAQRMRGDLPAEELGEFARFKSVIDPISSREKVDTFKAAFGEQKFRDYLRDILSMAKLQAMKAGKHESTTVDKLMEMADANPDGIMNIVTGLLAGAPVPRTRGTLQWAASALDRLAASKKDAGRTAKLLLRRGDDIPRTLDELLRLQTAGQQSSRPSRTRGKQGRKRFQPSNEAMRDEAARLAGALAGRE